MTRQPDFNEIIGDEVSAEERERLHRAHDLLLAAGPIPELPPELEKPSVGKKPDRLEENVYQLLPRRRTGAALALAAAIALIAFVGGYTIGFRHDGFSSQYTVAMHGASGVAASGQIKIGNRDSHGNWPLRVEVKGLPKLQRGYYEMFLTRGKHKWTCGTFAGGGNSTVKVRLTAPYTFQKGDSWIVTKQLFGHNAAGPTVLTT